MVRLIDPLVAVNEFVNDPDCDHIVEDVIFNVVVVPLTDCAMLMNSILCSNSNYQKLSSIYFERSACSAHLKVIE
jgi:hypothetical protein